MRNICIIFYIISKIFIIIDDIACFLYFNFIIWMQKIKETGGKKRRGGTDDGEQEIERFLNGKPLKKSKRWWEKSDLQDRKSVV